MGFSGERVKGGAAGSDWFSFRLESTKLYQCREILLIKEQMSPQCCFNAVPASRTSIQCWFSLSYICSV